MSPEEEENMRKMRVRIERDAYSVLLSFKDGASPRQVEQRMDDTLGYTYSKKYHTAGVYDMSQILREHPLVRTTHEGKFKIMATEENQDLVALIAKQKDSGKKKKNAVYGKGGRRAVTSMGHHHRSSGLFLRSSPKVPGGIRPLSSAAKPYTQRPFSNIAHIPRPFSTALSSRLTTSSKYGGSPSSSANRNASFNGTPTKPFSQVFTPIVVPPQRPLVRPSTAASVSSNTISQASSSTTITSQPHRPDQLLGHIPSIKEFSDNAKIMMLRLHPDSIHLSEMTDRYCLDYGVNVEPLQLFSKSWMMLVKTTFKEWLQINNGEVSLKNDWFEKYGSALKRSIPSQSSRSLSVSIPKISSNPVEPVSKISPKSVEPVLTVPKISILPISQGFRYQEPINKRSSVDMAIQQMEGLTVGNRHSLQTPEKPPGLGSKFSEEEDEKPSMGSYFPSGKPTMRKPKEQKYDAAQLRVLKFVEKPNEVKGTVAAALNETPQLKKTPKRSPKSSTWQVKDVSMSSGVPHTVETKVLSESNSKKVSGQDRSLTSIPKVSLEEIGARFCSKSVVPNRLIGRALADIHKQNGLKQKPVVAQKSLYQEKPFCAASSSSTNMPDRKKETFDFKGTDSDDGWSISSGSDETLTVPVAPVVTQRKLLLPPMSKGALPKGQIRSRPISISKSITSSDSFERALNATLPDDESWS